MSQGVLSVLQGGDFLQGFASGALGSLGAEAFGQIVGSWSSSTGGQIFFGALSGGVGAELTGGNFWQGAAIGGIVAGLNHVMHRGATDNDDEWMLMKDGSTVKVGNRGGNDIDYLYDEFSLAQTLESRQLLAITPVKKSIMVTGNFNSNNKTLTNYGYRISFRFRGHGLYDPSFDIMTNIPLSGGVTLTKMGLTRLPKSAYGLKVGLGGSSKMLQSSYFFTRTLGINTKMGVRLPTIMMKPTNNLGVFIGRNSAIIGTGSMIYGGYKFINSPK